jgi:hypothetical protein
VDSFKKAKYLIEKGADILKIESGGSPLEYALQYSLFDILLLFNLTPDFIKTHLFENHQTCLMLVVGVWDNDYSNDEEKIKKINYLLDNGAEENIDSTDDSGKNVFMYCCEFSSLQILSVLNRTDKIKLVLRNKDKENLNLLDYALKNKNANKDMIKFLVYQGIDVESTIFKLYFIPFPLFQELLLLKIDSFTIEELNSIYGEKSDDEEKDFDEKYVKDILIPTTKFILQFGDHKYKDKGTEEILHKVTELESKIKNGIPIDDDSHSEETINMMMELHEIDYSLKENFLKEKIEEKKKVS